MHRAPGSSAWKIHGNGHSTRDAVFPWNFGKLPGNLLDLEYGRLVLWLVTRNERPRLQVYRIELQFASDIVEWPTDESVGC